MNLAQSLHTAARRYCTSRYDYWQGQYAEISQAGHDRAADGYHYSSEALNVFPRYNVINAIRVELERLDPNDLEDLDGLREWIILVGFEANDDSTRPGGQHDARSMASERKAFCEFIETLSDSQLQLVEALPYRRVLLRVESDAIWSQIRERWEIADVYWFPLAKCSLPDVAAFRKTDFEEFCSSGDIVELLSSRGVSRIWELREYGPEYELDSASFDPQYDGEEGYWSSSNVDWVLYASHEGSVTIGGWLLSEIKDRWPGWKQCIWHSPFA